MNKWWLIPAAFLVAFQTQSQTENTVVGAPANELSQQFGIRVLEAEKRLAIQSHSEDVGGPIIDEFGERFAGSYIQQDPLALIIRLVGDQPVAPRSIATPDGPITVKFEVGAKNSLNHLKEVASSDRLRRTFPDMQGVGTDSKTGAVVIFLLDGGTFQVY